MDVILELIGVFDIDWVCICVLVDVVLYCEDGVVDVFLLVMVVLIELMRYYVDLIVEFWWWFVNNLMLVLLVVEFDGDWFFD